MKRLLALAMVTCMMITMVACGKQDEEPVSNTTDDSVKQEEVKEEATKDENVSEFEIDMAKFKIVDVRKATAKDGIDIPGEAPCVMITYEVTNKDEEPLDPSIAWMACVSPTQETETTVEDLGIPFTEFVEAEANAYYNENVVEYGVEIKTDATIKNVAVYTIKYPDKPVTLNFTQGVGGKDLGKYVIE